MKGKVLYIEDETFFANTISNKLKEYGFDVDLAADGESGLRALTETAYDIILLDLVLPHIGGFDVLKQIPAIEKNKKTPVIVLSNLSSDSDKRTARQLGAREFYVKMNSTPSNIATLVISITGQGADAHISS